MFIRGKSRYGHWFYQPEVTCSNPVPPTKNLDPPKEELTTGSTFAVRYQIIEEFRKSGIGKVYRAIDNKLNEKVVMKLIKPEMASDKKTLEQFGNELKLARKIVHRDLEPQNIMVDKEGNAPTFIDAKSFLCYHLLC